MFIVNSQSDNVNASHKASFWMAAWLMVVGIVLLGLSFSFEPAQTGLSTDWDVETVFFVLCESASLSVAISVILTQIFGLTGYALMNKGLVITYIIFSSFCVIIASVCVAIPSIGAAAVTIACEAARASETDFSSDPDYQIICVSMQARFNADVAFIAICGGFSLVAAILGCVNASAVGRREVVQTTYVHTTPAANSNVVVTVQPQQMYAYPPQQGGYPPQQGGYPPQQGGYPPQQGGYPPQQGGYPPQQGGYPPQQGGYPPQQGGYPPPQQQQNYPPQSGYPEQPPAQGYNPPQSPPPAASSP